MLCNFSSGEASVMRKGKKLLVENHIFRVWWRTNPTHCLIDLWLLSQNGTDQTTHSFSKTAVQTSFSFSAPPLPFLTFSHFWMLHFFQTLSYDRLALYQHTELDICLTTWLKVPSDLGLMLLFPIIFGYNLSMFWTDCLKGCGEVWQVKRMVWISQNWQRAIC